MDAETIKGLRQAENRLALPLVAPELIDDSEFELSDTDIRLGLIQRVGGMSLSGEVDVDSVLSRQERSHLQFLYNLEDYIVQNRNGNGDSQLREHQHEVFDDIYNFLAQPKVDEAGEIQRRGYIELPTGSGKTAIFSTLVNVLNRPLPETDKKPKALVLVPKLDLVTQTVGIDGRRGFAQFASDTDVTEYHGTKKDLSGDAVVMSYQSLIKAVERGDVTEEDFDLIICDEAHRALGDRTRVAVEKIANGNLMIGLTASPEFRSKHVKDFFPEQIHSMELREAIEMNLLSPVRCFAVTSDAEIETLKSGEFSEKELAQLIENEWRNRKTVEFVKAFVQEGKAGIVSCIPGEDIKHAQDIADAINQEFIEDPITGELRRIKALAVSGTSENRQDIYEAFERGEIDVLTYVDVLTEGWDSTRAKFLVNLRPTTSPVNAIQRLGRVLRKAEDPEEIATVVEFIDKTEKPLYTFFHVLGEETIEQGKRFGKPRNITGGDLEGPDDEDRDTDVNLELPQELIDKLAEINHINIRELVVQPEVITVAENPDEWLSIPMLTELTGIAQSTIKGLLEKLEIETAYIRRTTKPALHVTFENAQILLDYIANNSERPDGYLNAIEIAREYKANNHRVMNAIKELELEGREYRREGGRRFVAYSPEQISEVISKVGIVSEAPEGWLSTAGIAKALGGVNTKGVNDALEFFGYKGEKMRRGSKHTMYFSPDQVEQVRDFYVTMKPPEGWVPKSKVAEFLGVTKGQAQQRIDDAGIIGGTFPYKAGQQSIYYRPEDLEKLK